MKFNCFENSQKEKYVKVEWDRSPLKEINYEEELDAEEPHSPEVNVAWEDLTVKSTEGRKGSLIYAVISSTGEGEKNIEGYINCKAKKPKIWGVF
jgi:hypothetical protein